jgi:hypothetical protein
MGNTAFWAYFLYSRHSPIFMEIVSSANAGMIMLWITHNIPTYAHNLYIIVYNGYSDTLHIAWMAYSFAL